MRMQNISALSRPLDMEYPDNRLIVMIFVVVLISSISLKILSGVHPVPGAIWGGRAALSVFLAWALTKEIDPDHPASAAIASFLGISALFLFNSTSILFALLLLLLIRMVNRTTGIPLTLFDSMLIMLTGIYLVWSGKWIYGIVMAIAFFMDAVLEDPVRRHFLFAGISLLACLFGSYRSGIEIDIASGSSSFALLLLVLFLILRIMLAGNPHSVNDTFKERLSGERVIAASIIALSAGMVALSAGPEGIIVTFPLWAAIAGTVVFDVAQRMSKLYVHFR